MIRPIGTIMNQETAIEHMKSGGFCKRQFFYWKSNILGEIQVLGPDGWKLNGRFEFLDGHIMAVSKPEVKDRELTKMEMAIAEAKWHREQREKEAQPWNHLP